MPFNKGTLDKYSIIVTKELEARNANLSGSITIGGNLIVTGSISGSSIDATAEGPVSAPSLTVTGSAVITGSLDVGTNLNLSGSLRVSSLDVTGSANIGENAIVSGSFSASSITTTGSSSGSSFYGATATITNILTTTITGSEVVSGSTVYGSTISGSTIISALGRRPPNYTIYSGAGAGGPYFAQDDVGNIDYSGSDATIVIQNALGNMTGSGGKIFFKNGRYHIDGIKVYTSGSTLILQGESYNGTCFILKDNATGSISYLGTGSYAQRAMFLVDGFSGGATTGSRIIFRDLYLHGNRENQINDVAGIVVRDSDETIVENCYISYTSRFGIRADGYSIIRHNKVYRVSTTGSDAQYPVPPVESSCVGIWSNKGDSAILDNMVGWTGRYSTPSAHRGYGIVCATSNTVDRNWVWSADVAIYVSGSDTSVQNSFIEQVGPRAGIVVKGDTNLIAGNRIRMGATDENPAVSAIEITGSSAHNLIQDNKIFARSSSYNITTAIRELGTADNNHIVNNSISDAHSDAITNAISFVGASTKVKNIYGYDTEHLAASAFVYSGSDTIRAVDRFGFLRRTGSEPSNVINWAISNLLTSGRAAKEKIIIFGTHTLTGAINVPDYTIFELQGKFTLVSGSASGSYDYHQDLLHNADATNGNSHIEIVGGEYDGNWREGNNYLPTGSGYWNYDGLNCIYFGGTSANCDDILVENVICRRAGTVNLHFDSCDNVTVKNCKFYDPFYHGTHIGSNAVYGQNRDFTWINVFSEGPVAQPSSARNYDGSAFTDGYQGGTIRYIGCTATGSYASGFSITLNSGTTGSQIFITDCHSINSCRCQLTSPTGSTTQAGIKVAAGTNDFLTIKGCIVKESYGAGISANMDDGRLTIVGNIVSVITGAAGNDDGITLKGNYGIIANNSIYVSGAANHCLNMNGNYCVIQGNSMYGSNRGIGCYSTYHDLIFTGNYVSGSNTVSFYNTNQTGLVLTNNVFEDGITTSTAFRLVKNNVGYVTENFGTASINSPSGSFVHGLSVSPSFVSLLASGSIPTQISWTHSGSAGIWVYHDAGGQISVNWKAEA